MTSPKLQALLTKKESTQKELDEQRQALADTQLSLRAAFIADDSEDQIASLQTTMAMLENDIERLTVRIEATDDAISAQEEIERGELVDTMRKRTERLAKRKGEYGRDIEAALTSLAKAWTKYRKLDEELLDLTHAGFLNPHATDVTAQIRQYVQVELERCDLLDPTPRIGILHGQTFGDLADKSHTEIRPR